MLPNLPQRLGPMRLRWHHHVPSTASPTMARPSILLRILCLLLRSPGHRSSTGDCSYNWGLPPIPRLPRRRRRVAERRSWIWVRIWIRSCLRTPLLDDASTHACVRKTATCSKYGGIRLARSTIVSRSRSRASVRNREFQTGTPLVLVDHSKAVELQHAGQLGSCLLGGCAGADDSIRIFVVADYQYWPAQPLATLRDLCMAVYRGEREYQ